MYFASGFLFGKNNVKYLLVKRAEAKLSERLRYFMR